MAIPLSARAAIAVLSGVLFCLSAAPAKGQSADPLLFDPPPDLSSAQQDALSLELASRNYQLHQGSFDGIAPRITLESQVGVDAPTLTASLRSSAGQLIRTIRVQGTLASIDARSLAIAVGSLFDPLPAVTHEPAPPQIETASPESTSQTQASPAAQLPPKGPPRKEDSDWAPKPGDWFVLLHGGIAARNQDPFSVGSSWLVDLQAAVGFGFYLFQVLRMEISTAVTVDTLEPVRMGLVFDVPVDSTHIHAGIRGAFVLESQQRAAAFGVVLGVAWETFDDVLMGPRLYFGYEPVLDSNRDTAFRSDEVIGSISFHTTFHLDP